MKSPERQSSARPASKPDPLAPEGSGLAEFGRKHGNKILIVLAVAFLVLAAVRYKKSQAAQQAAQAQSALVSAWNGVDQVQQLQFNAVLSKTDVSKQVTQLESDVNQAVQLVIDNSDASTDASRLASAWLARGELFWNFAQFPPAAPTTQPATTQISVQVVTKTPAQYLDLAANAYGKIVSDYPSQQVPATIARFALAAIAENKKDFAAARTQYKALIETPNLPAANQSMAEQRLAKLNDLEKPILLLPATQPVAKVVPESLNTNLPPLDLHMGPQAMPTTKP